MIYIVVECLPYTVDNIWTEEKLNFRNINQNSDFS